MKNITKIALLFVVAMVFSSVQVQAEATKTEVNPVDAIALKAWNTVETEKVATQEDKISLIAWTTSQKEQEELLAMGEYTPVAFAADIEEKNPVDAISYNVWTN